MRFWIPAFLIVLLLLILLAANIAAFDYGAASEQLGVLLLDCVALAWHAWACRPPRKRQLVRTRS